MKNMRARRACAAAFISLVFITAPLSGGEPYQYVFNPNENDIEVNTLNWRAVLGREDIRDWAKSMKMEVLDDRGPVKDGSAAFVSRFGSRMVVIGMERRMRYTMWIDFVTCARPRAGLPSSILEISVKGQGGRFVTIDSVPLKEFTGLYRVDIPYEYTVSGTAEIRFYDTSLFRDLWGMWDIIVTREGDLPRVLEPEPDAGIKLPESDKIIE